MTLSSYTGSVPFILLLFLFFTPLAHAEKAQTLIPKTITAEVGLEQSIAEAASHASVELRGRGSALKLRYESAVPIDMVILFLESDRSFQTLDALTVTLPQGEISDLIVPIVGSTAWTPWETLLRIHFLSADEKGATFHALEFVRGQVVDTLEAAVGQALALEPYTPSSYHRLRGPRVFGRSLTLFVGVLLIAFTALLLHRRKRKQAFALLFLGLLLTQLRFTLDAVRFTIAHTSEWNTNRTYSAAGSVYEIADTLKDYGVKRVRLCSDGTSYLPTLLKYALYPLPVGDKSATHTLISRSYQWSYGGGKLTCKGVTVDAEKITTFPDGSLLFRHAPLS